METFLPFLPLQAHIQMARLTPQPSDLIKTLTRIRKENLDSYYVE